MQPNNLIIIRSKLSARTLDVTTTNQQGHSIGDLILHDYGGGLNQQFYLIPDGPFYTLKVKDSGKVIQVPYGKQQNGVIIKASDSNGELHQKWKIVERNPGSGDYLILNAKTNKALDVKQYKGGNHARIHQWDQHKDDNQTWILSPA